MSTPSIRSDYPGMNGKLTRVEVNGLVYYFSYATCVAFRAVDQRRPVARKNVWGPTTGKHLNFIDGGEKANRVDAEEFDRLLAEAEGAR